ncbi:hypothetical protein BT96DRAFT_947695 [Gymnopus androsaceus JB14]|uniref:Uncharacterized protein n=1 Tax=Gymnopus androsaceus JB14 TaxID=1447944 RepID=A0A6A4GSC2_9AGAR|nr:hypothetical protein BT96DRAFT_947695 [Gymnopus androsaceus JB14]
MDWIPSSAFFQISSTIFASHAFVEMPSSTNPRLIASSRTATAPYPPTIAGSSDTDNEVQNTRGCRRKVKSQATRCSAHLQAISLPIQEEFEALKEKAELAQKQLLDLTAKRTEQFTCPICYGPPFQPYMSDEAKMWIGKMIRRPPGVLLSSGNPALSQQFYCLSSTFQNSTENSIVHCSHCSQSVNLETIKMTRAVTSEPNKDYFHAAIDSNIYTFVHGIPFNFPTVPPKDQIIDPDYKAPSFPNFNTPVWATDSVPFLGFVPSSNPFKLQLSDDSHRGGRRAWATEFSSLTIADERVGLSGAELAHVPHGLHERNKWDSLIRDNQPKALLDINPLWSERRKELEQIHRSPPASRWDWDMLLQKETSLSWEWLSFFKDQVLQLPTVGIFLYATTSSGCLSLLPIFLEASMPLAIYWGNSENWSTSHVLAGLFPMRTDTIVNELISHQDPSGSLMQTMTAQQMPTASQLTIHCEAPYPSHVMQEAASTFSTVQQIPPSSELVAFLEKREECTEQPTLLMSQLPNIRREWHAKKMRRRINLQGKGALVFSTGIWRVVEESVNLLTEWDVCTDLDPSDVPFDSEYLEDLQEADDDIEIDDLEEGKIAGESSGQIEPSVAYLEQLHNKQKISSVPVEFQDQVDKVAFH